MKKELILLIDDDRGILESSEILLSDEFFILTASNVSDAKKVLASRDIRLVVVDLDFDGHEEDGLDLIDHILKKCCHIPFIVLSGDKETKRVVEATKRPLIDFIIKDGDHEELLRMAIRKGLARRKEFDDKRKNCNKFKTKSPEVLKIFKNIDKLLSSRSNASILINGESGTGKEYMAKYIASFLGKKLIASNMASIPKETAESELFGHIKGAFTGAISNKVGLLEKAHNGIFFLDEIGDCSLEIQAKLLRVIEEKEVMPVGSTTPKKINIRFIAATHKNLNDLINLGQFRLDLQQRLNTFIFKIPALRERPEDIEYYATMFINELSKDGYYRIEPSAFVALKEYHWPGNVRELKNVIERSTVYTDKRSIDDMTIYNSLDISMKQRPIETHPSFNFNKLKETEITSLIVDTLKKTNGNKSVAAKLMGVHFSTLHRWIKKYNIDHLIPHRDRGRPKVYVNTKENVEA